MKNLNLEDIKNIKELYKYLIKKNEFKFASLVEKILSNLSLP